MGLFVELLIAFWIIIPAYAANGFAPLAKGKRAMDFGIMFRNRPIFGSGKTWEGFLFAIFVGTLVGLVQIAIYPKLATVAIGHGISLPSLSIVSVVAVSVGAMIGDLVGSVIKRQSGIPRGEPAPILDQLDFVIGALVVAAPFVVFTLEQAVLISAFTPIIHLTANLVGYKIGSKSVPW